MIEYKEVTVSRGTIDQLNYLGKDGWQVVSAEYHHITTDYLLMREVRETQPNPLAIPVHYTIEDTPLRQIHWDVQRKARGYPQYNLRCECGWIYHHPSAVVSKQAADAHKCFAKVCKHGLTKNMGCAVCKDEDYSYA